MRLLLALALVVALLAPLIARGQGAAPKSPLDYSVRQYGFMLAVAVLGGLVSWWAKVRRGEAAAWNVMQLIGELCTSAFAGLLAFWLCEWSGAPPLLTAAMVGISGHMGTRAIAALEEIAQRRWRIELPPAAAPSGFPQTPPADKDTTHG